MTQQMPAPTNPPSAASASEDAEAISALSNAERLLLARQWQGRAHAESIACVRFARLLADIAHSGTSPAVLELLAFAVGEEWRHAIACAKLAATYAGREMRLPTRTDDHSPPYREHPDDIAATLRLVGVSCISEMIAAAWLQECLEATTVPCVRETLRELLRDDVRHARIGWAHLATRSLSGCDNQHDLGPHLHRLFDESATPWLHEDDLPPEGFPAHGIPSRRTTRETVFLTVREIVLPGFEQVGMDAEPGRKWLREAEARYPLSSSAGSA